MGGECLPVSGPHYSIPFTLQETGGQTQSTTAPTYVPFLPSSDDLQVNDGGETANGTRHS